MSRAGVTPKTDDGSAGEERRQDDADDPADEGRRQHHPLDADVDDAGALAHDAAQGGRGRSASPTAG